MDHELNKMTVPELSSLIERAKNELEARKIQSKDRLKEEILTTLQNTGLDLADLFPETAGKKKKSKQSGETKPAPIKYRDPVSQGTWSGRGARPPAWVKSIMMERRWTLEEFKSSGEYDF
jgi:DNA-binding protein H-NS